MPASQVPKHPFQVDLEAEAAETRRMLNIPPGVIGDSIWKWKWIVIFLGKLMGSSVQLLISSTFYIYVEVKLVNMRIRTWAATLSGFLIHLQGDWLVNGSTRQLDISMNQILGPEHLRISRNVGSPECQNSSFGSETMFSLGTWRFPESWGYPQSSSILVGCSLTKTIHFGDLPHSLEDSPVLIPVLRHLLRMFGYLKASWNDENPHWCILNKNQFHDHSMLLHIDCPYTIMYLSRKLEVQKKNKSHAKNMGTSPANRAEFNNWLEGAGRWRTTRCWDGWDVDQVGSETRRKIHEDQWESMEIQTKLVGGLVAIFYFPIYWVANYPNWLSYFSEGWLTTNQTTNPCNVHVKSVNVRGNCSNLQVPRSARSFLPWFSWEDVGRYGRHGKIWEANQLEKGPSSNLINGDFLRGSPSSHPLKNGEFFIVNPPILWYPHLWEPPIVEKM